MAQRRTPSPPDGAVTSWSGVRAWRGCIYASKLKPRTAMLALLLADHVNEQRGWCAWPSQSTLATKLGETGHGRRKIATRLAELIEAGWIAAPDRGRSGAVAHYWLTTPTGQPAPDFVHHLPPKSGHHLPPKSGHHLPPKSGHEIPSTTHGVARKSQRPEQAADPAEADASPVAAPISRFLTDPLEVIQG